MTNNLEEIKECLSKKAKNSFPWGLVCKKINENNEKIEAAHLAIKKADNKAYIRSRETRVN